MGNGKLRLMRKVIALLFILLPIGTWAAEQTANKEATGENTEEARKGVFKGYSGGMMLHLGYQYGQGTGFLDTNGDEAFLRSITYGIGGALKIHLFKHWKIGGEGFVSTMPLKSQGDGSNIRYGWGGMLNEAYVQIGRTQPFIGCTLGGGAQRTTHVYSGDGTLSNATSFKEWWEQMKGYKSLEETYPANFTKRGFFAFDPYIGIDFAATKKLHVIMRADWLLAVHKGNLLMPTGPRLYLGLMFTH